MCIFICTKLPREYTRSRLAETNLSKCLTSAVFWTPSTFQTLSAERLKNFWTLTQNAWLAGERSLDQTNVLGSGAEYTECFKNSWRKFSPCTWVGAWKELRPTLQWATARAFQVFSRIFLRNPSPPGPASAHKPTLAHEPTSTENWPSRPIHPGLNVRSHTPSHPYHGGHAVGRLAWHSLPYTHVDEPVRAQDGPRKQFVEEIRVLPGESLKTSVQRTGREPILRNLSSLRPQWQAQGGVGHSGQVSGQRTNRLWSRSHQGQQDGPRQV